MRLNLGCGSDIRHGYVNVDFRELPGVDRVVDLSSFPWPFETSSCDEVLMFDFLEHFPYGSTSLILVECYRVLRPNGQLAVQVPDAEILGSVLCSRGTFQCNRCGHVMRGQSERDLDLLDGADGYDRECPGCRQPAAEVFEAAVRRMFGGQDSLGNFHQTCFSHTSLIRRADECGLDFIGCEEEDHQAANWNMKCRFERGDLWG